MYSLIRILNTVVFHNKDLSDLEIEYLFYKFSTAQRIYSSFRKIANIFNISTINKNEIYLNDCKYYIQNFFEI